MKQIMLGLFILLSLSGIYGEYYNFLFPHVHILTGHAVDESPFPLDTIKREKWETGAEYDKLIFEKISNGNTVIAKPTYIDLSRYYLYLELEG